MGERRKQPGFILQTRTTQMLVEALSVRGLRLGLTVGKKALEVWLMDLQELYGQSKAIWACFFYVTFLKDNKADRS